MNRRHRYKLRIRWTGNLGEGTRNYRAYERSHSIQAEKKAEISGSSDPAFLGDPERYNPEELFVAALSSCHMLWYLHLCAEAGIVVTAYEDHATGIMEETPDGGGHFTEVTLNPIVSITDELKIDKANALHSKANEKCFIANSVKFPVLHVPVCKAPGDGF
ncbi:MAG: OsmC family protein [Cyclobacteriaceae bacterium]|nr:OsmC family protein [Cyclobacteriaceae bacterium]